jgi:aryl-alcohol dehydrogenase-like predicted oxidoreductase
LLWVHFPDHMTPTEEILRGLDDLARQGKILHAGLSNFPAWRTSRAVAIADLRGLNPVIAAQFEYSLVERTAERDVLPMVEALGLGGTPWSPLGGGLLTGKYRASRAGRLTDWGNVTHQEDTQQKTAVVDAGPRTLPQLEDYLSALNVQLDAEQYKRLDEVSSVSLGQPQGVMDGTRGAILGGDPGRFGVPVIPVA